MPVSWQELGEVGARRRTGLDLLYRPEIPGNLCARTVIMPPAKK